MNHIFSKYKYLLFILIISLLLSIPLLYKNLNVYFDDGIQHIGRAYLTYLAIHSNENVNVLSSLCNGFGYSWNLFYGSFSTTFILICKLFTSTFLNAYKLVLFLGLFLSRNNNVWIYE